jgi:hypothetical protein
MSDNVTIDSLDRFDGVEKAILGALAPTMEGSPTTRKECLEDKRCD